MILKLFNIFFRISLIFLLCFIWIRYFIDEFWLSILYTCLLTISIEFIIHFILTKRNSKKCLKNEDEKLSEKISATFIFSPKDAVDYFYNLAKINYIAKKYSKYILISNKKNTQIINENENKTILYPFYTYSSISPQNLVDIIKNIEKQKTTKVIICGYKIDPLTYKLSQKISDSKIILLNSKDCYLKLIKFNNFYPENLKELNLKEKLKFKEILKLSISKKNTKGYFISSLILLFSSFIIRLNIYYLIMSSVLLLLSLISFFLPQNSIKMGNDIL